MKKLMFLAVCFILTLTSCSNLDDVLPDQSNSRGSDDTGFDDRGGSSSSSSASVNISLTLVPSKAKEQIPTAYKTWTIKEAEQELEHGQVQYKLTLINGNNKVRLLFDANWNFLRVKN